MKDSFLFFFSGSSNVGENTKNGQRVALYFVFFFFFKHTQRNQKEKKIFWFERIFILILKVYKYTNLKLIE